MAYTVNDLQQLQSAFSSGVRSVKFKDREVLYSSTDDLKAAIIEVRADLALQAAIVAQVPSPRITRLYTSSGFNSNNNSGSFLD